MSYRVDIREAFKDMLVAGNTIAGTRVFTKLDRPLKPSDLPAIVVYTTMARRGQHSSGDTYIPRVVTVSIEAALTATPATAQDDAETFAEAIEDIIEADPTLGHLVTNTEWMQTVGDVTSVGSETIGVVLVEYEVQISTNAKPADFLEFVDGPFPETAPTQVFIAPEPTAAAYVVPLDTVSTDAPAMPLDEAEILRLLEDDIASAPSEPPQPVDPPPCEDGSCAPSVWQGDPE